MDVPDELRCKYNGGVCPNRRAERNNGRSLRVCEFHRRRANAHQKDYQRRRKRLAKMTQGDRLAPSPLHPQPVMTPVQAASSGPAAPPRVVFVLASEKELGESLQQLSSAGDLSLGQPFEIMSAGQFTNMLRGFEVGPSRGSLDTMALDLDSIKFEEDLEPLPFEYVGGQKVEPAPIQLPDDFVNSLFAEDGLFSNTY